MSSIEQNIIFLHLQEAGNVGYDKEMFGSAANVGDRYKKMDEFWSIANKTFASEDEAFTFYNNYARDKGFSVRKEKVRRSSSQGQFCLGGLCVVEKGSEMANDWTMSITAVDHEP